MSAIRISRALAAHMQASCEASTAQAVEALPRRTTPLRARLRIRLAQLLTESRQLTSTERRDYLRYAAGLIAQHETSDPAIRRP